MPDQRVDPERPRGVNPSDREGGYSGQEYRATLQAAEPPSADETSEVTEGERDLPPDAGRRASVDPATGEVHGSGSGAGGGNPGEDFDSSSPSGDSYPVTGGEGARR